MEALLKRGVIEQADVDAIVGDAANYTAALCVEAAPEVEREARRLLALIRKAEQNVAPMEEIPVPILEPTKS